MTTSILNTNTSEVQNKIPNTSILVTATVLNTKISEVENEIPDHALHILLLNLISLRQKILLQDLKKVI